MADEIDATFKQFLDEQKRTNGLLQQQAVGKKKDDKVAQANHEEEMSQRAAIAKREQTEKDRAAKEEATNTDRARLISTAELATGGQQGQEPTQEVLPVQAEPDQPNRIEQNDEVPENAQETEPKDDDKQKEDDEKKKEDDEKKKSENEKKRQETERNLLGLTEKSYEQFVEQRKAADEAEKDLKDLKKIFGANAEESKKYQDAKTKSDKEEAKLRKIANRRSLLQRFKERVPFTGARKEAKEKKGGGGGIFGKMFGKGFGFIKKLFSKFIAIFSIALLGLIALVNSPIFEKVKKALFDFVDFFADRIYPILLRAKDQLMPPLEKLYNDFIKPLFTFIGDFLTRDGGGLEIIFEGFEKALNNVMKIFKNIKDIFVGITEGDFSKVFDAVGDLIGNIINAIADLASDIIKFILSFFKVDGKGKTGFQMLKGVMSNFLKSISEAIGNLFVKAMKGIESFLRGMGLNFIADKLFGEESKEERITREKKEAAEDEKKDNIKRIQRQINKSRDDERKAKMRVSVARRDVDDDRKGFFNRSKDTEEDKRLEDIKLFNEREKLEMIQEERAALEGEKAKAEAAPISINAPTNNVVNQSKQESTITQPIAMNATGSTAALARGGGFMSSGIGE